MIRNRIAMRTRVTQDGKMIRDEATHELLQDIPIYIKQAVVDLQRDNLLPPRTLTYISQEVKEEQRDNKDVVKYNYIRLPKDFRELKELTIGGEFYKAEDNYLYISKRYNVDNRPRYTILRVDDDKDQEPTERLILYPYPSDDIEIEVKYYIDGSEISLRRLDEKYNSVILKKVETYLQLSDVVSTQEEINAMVGQSMNPRGINPHNNSTPRLRPRYFGR